MFFANTGFCQENVMLLIIPDDATHHKNVLISVLFVIEKRSVILHFRLPPP